MEGDTFMKLFNTNPKLKRLLCGLLCMALVLGMFPLLQKPVEAATTGYDRGYNQGMPGSGKIVAHGLDVSAWQESGLNFQIFKNAGYKYVILRCGTSVGKDKCFEEYYNSAKAAGLDVGCYFYSYALDKATAQQEARNVLSWIQGKTFEYPVYFDFEDPTQIDLSYALSADICRGFMDILKDNGYLVGLYSMSWMLNRSWIDTSGIRATYEGWVAHVYSDAANTGITSNEYNIYKDRYQSVYGMHQYSFTTYVSGTGPYDANVSYKDYPAIVKQYGFNGYGPNGWLEDACFDPMVYRDRNKDLANMTDAQLKEHWLNFGIKEGRPASAILDLKYYRENNKDLQEAFGTDYTKYYNHFISSGYKEKRKSSQLFDGAYYTTKYPDIEQSYVGPYLKHYVDHGMAEGRRASLLYDPNYYWVVRTDVAQAWPGDYVMAAKHYAGHGINDKVVAYDNQKPVISNVKITDISATGYTVTCTVTDNWEVSKVVFPSWTVANGNDDLADNFMNTQKGTKNGNTYTFRVKTSDHGNQLGLYATHIYAVDKGDNQTVMELDPITVKDPDPNQLVLVSNSSYKAEKGLLKNVKQDTTVEALRKQFENEDLRLVDHNGTMLINSDKVGTGTVVNLYLNGSKVDSITVVILGDLDGNGYVNTTDYLRVKAYLLGTFSFNAAQLAAADVDTSDSINSTDYLRIKSHFLGTYKLPS